MDYGALIRQLQGAMGGKAFIGGHVASNGTILIGSGFSVVKNATGDYTVTLDSPLRSVPVVQVTAGVSSLHIAKLFSTMPTASSFRVATYSSAFASVDGDFTFLAWG